jgi:hypothetical protein
VLDTEIESRFDHGRFVLLAAGDDGPSVGIQRVPEAKATKNRVHVDVEVDALEQMTRWVRQHGGLRVADHQVPPVLAVGSG